MADRGGIVTLAGESPSSSPLESSPSSTLESTARNARRGVVSITRNDLRGTPGDLLVGWFRLTGTIAMTAGCGHPCP